ncbi:MAG: hypothetical protein ABEI52_09640, partial [Halobacteriaceae archaeon]
MINAIANVFAVGSSSASTEPESSTSGGTMDDVDDIDTDELLKNILDGLEAATVIVDESGE